ncbi:hypothetical protein QTP70_011872 [Hemibagrus guttatus]|uniref:Reverse transcriptase domain-containing protein n=1 Tax=Hemibagrus guttatus TaxID=175788 RepID=A0AAE0ULG2_9TELE|nr:hypothetical protein QTP70_011872 [Hemibagrus guttatus]
MGRGSPIPSMLRRKIVEQYQKGVSQRKIAKSLKLSSSTVHNIIQRFRESGTISVRKGQGRKTILDARDLRALRRHGITYRNATVMEITTWAQEYFQKTLSVNTIHRAIRRCRLKLYRSKKKPYLNMIQKRRRFLWAKAHLKWTVAKWKTVLWSDESKFEVLFGKLGRHFIRTKEDKDNPSCYQRSVQKPASLMVWGCMSACGIGSLHIWKGTINAESIVRYISAFFYFFVDLEKAYDRVPREELWYCMRKSGVAEKYVRVVQDMYERSRTVVRCAVGQTEEFNVEVGLHQGSALSPFLFAIVMDRLSEEVRQESPWTMMFADDIVICSESREQVEENLERWRFALERRGMKVSRGKTEYMCVNEREGSGTVRSTDYGTTYEKLNEKVGVKTILSYLYVSPNNKRKIMLLTDPEVENSLLISTDEGATYQKYRLGFYVLSLLFHPEQEDWILAYSHDQKNIVSSDQMYTTVPEAKLAICEKSPEGPDGASGAVDSVAETCLHS